MKPLEYFLSLGRDDQRDYASRAGTSWGYLRLHIFTKGGFKKRPKDQLLVDLVIESEGHISLEEAKQYFYDDRVDQLYKDCCLVHDTYHRSVTKNV